MSRNLRISPWKLKKDEAAQLHWCSSPHRNQDGQWIMTLYFLRLDGSIVSHVVPWGLLPYLKLGGTYEDGKLTDRIQGYFDRLVLKPNQQVQLLPSSEIPRNLYQTFFMPDYVHEWMCSFQINQILYFVPCIELVRAFMTPTKTLTEALLSVGGLESLYDGMTLESGSLHIDLSPEYPYRIATPEYILHLAWLLNNNSMLREWNKVRNRLLTRTDTHSEKTIRIIPPISHPTTLQYRYIQIGNMRFVLGVIGLEDIVAPRVNTIFYSHPKLKGSEKTSGQRYQKVEIPGGCEDLNADHDMSEEPAKSADHTKTVSAPSVFYKYLNRPDTKSVRNKKTQVKSGEIIQVGGSVGTAPDSNEKKPVSASKWSASGAIDPVEFDVLERASDDDTFGLEEFIRFVHRFKEENPQLSIQLSIYYLPEGKTFSLAPGGVPRTCAIVRIEGLGKYPIFIVEISRPDRWNISTLVMTQKTETPIKQHDLFDCLTSMLDNYGHWNEDTLDHYTTRFSVHLVKHQKKGAFGSLFQCLYDLIS